MGPLLLFLLGGVIPRVPPRYSVHLNGHSSVSGADFRVELTRQADILLVRCGRMDSIRYAALHQDPHFRRDLAAVEANQLPAAERTRTFERLLELADQYKVYRWDSLRVATSRYSAFVQLLDSLSGSSAAALGRWEANQDRIVLDGTTVHLVVRKGQRTTQDLYVNSPGPASHPQLYRVLHGALELYRQEHPAPLLDRQFTRGY
ncbi:hypothetical protein GCM10027346_41500 [Hymenobacter seoulensis]